MILETEKRALLLKKDLEQQVGNSGEKPRIQYGSGRSSERKGSDSKLSMFVLEASSTTEDEWAWT